MANPPTARGGMRNTTAHPQAEQQAALANEHATSAAHSPADDEPKPEPAVQPLGAALNPTEAQVKVEDDLPKPFPNEPDFDPASDLINDFPERRAILREALSHFASAMVGVEAAVRARIAHPTGLNPNTAADQERLKIVLEGIANARKLQSELA